jgi:hypothetical protein
MKISHVIATAHVANVFSGVLDVAWEIDIWGRIRRAAEAARAQFLASEDIRRGGILPARRARSRARDRAFEKGARRRLEAHRRRLDGDAVTMTANSQAPQLPACGQSTSCIASVHRRRINNLSRFSIGTRTASNPQ